MNYDKVYNSLIGKSRSGRDIPIDTYTERHHIIPKCMGGGNEAANIAILTAREHFIAHWLLYKIHKKQKAVVRVAVYV